MSKEKQIDRTIEYLNNAINVERNSYFGKGCITMPLIEADKILDILQGYRKQSEWISAEETLPESGVHCLLCCDIKCIDGTHRQYVCDGYYAERWKEGCCYVDDDAAIEYNEENDEYYLLEGWYEVIKNWDDYNSIAIDDTVTHWMPLPEAPKMKGGGE